MRSSKIFRALRYMSSAKSISAKSPLITILGATGTGKSELAVSLAQRLNGEVINGDALQLYQGLPIVTNKITEAEQHGIKHHLLGVVPLTELSWTVSQFTSKAIQIIEDIKVRGKIPILVGGTHYYLQSTLFKDALVEDHSTKIPGNSTDDEALEKAFLSNEDVESKWPILAAGSEAIRAELERVDPVMARRWHPKDVRKIRRSLMIYLQTGRPASEIYAEQLQQRKDSEATIVDTSLRYDNILFWTHTKLEVLDVRLESRVGKMIERGLLDEVKSLDEFRKSQQAVGLVVDDTRGIWVAIGYKQYAEYLQMIDDSDVEHTEQDIEKALAYGKEKTFFSTRQYARSQIKWIKHKLLPSLVESGIRDRFFLLDSTDISTFGVEVEDKAATIAENWLARGDLPAPASISDTAAEVLACLDGKDERERSIQTCEVCDVTVTTEHDWALHLKSSKHRGRVKRQLQDARNPERAEMVAQKRAEAQHARAAKLQAQAREDDGISDSRSLYF